MKVINMRILSIFILILFTSFLGVEEQLIDDNDLLLTIKESKAKHNLLIISGPYAPKVKEIVDNKTTVWFAADEGQFEVIGNELSKQSTFGYFLIKGLKGAANANDD